MNLPHAITFDAGHTLLEAVNPLDHYRERALAHGAAPHEAQDIWKPLAEAMQQAARERSADTRCDDDLERAHWTRVVDLLADAFPPFAMVDRQAWLDDLWDHYGSPDAWRPYSDTVDTLNFFQESGVRLGLISNWDTRLTHILQAHSLNDFFDVVAVSCAVGIRKPDPQLFSWTLERLDSAPDKTWHVGDNRTDDVQAADDLGMTGILIDRWDSAHEIPKRVTSLFELTRWQPPAHAR